MDYLDELEAEAIFILREVAGQLWEWECYSSWYELGRNYGL